MLLDSGLHANEKVHNRTSFPPLPVNGSLPKAQKLKHCHMVIEKALGVSKLLLTNAF